MKNEISSTVVDSTNQKIDKNRIITIYIEGKAISRTMSGWAKFSGLSLHTLWMRIETYQWDIVRAILTPKQGGK